MARKAVDSQAQVEAVPLWQATLMRMGPRARLLAEKMRNETAKKARQEHYPAPFRLIDLFETHGGNLEAMKVAETRAFVPLMLSDTATQPAPRVHPLGDAEGAGAARTSPSSRCACT